jgi:hypothetical protein
MRVRINSLKSFTIIPDSDEEKLVIDSWFGKHDWDVSPCVNNAGMDHPARFTSLTFSISGSKCSKESVEAVKINAEELLQRWHTELKGGYLSGVDWSAPGADYTLPMDTVEYFIREN